MMFESFFNFVEKKVLVKYNIYNFVHSALTHVYYLQTVFINKFLNITHKYTHT